MVVVHWHWCSMSVSSWPRVGGPWNRLDSVEMVWEHVCLWLLAAQQVAHSVHVQELKEVALEMSKSVGEVKKSLSQWVQSFHSITSHSGLNWRQCSCGPAPQGLQGGNQVCRFGAVGSGWLLAPSFGLHGNQVQSLL